MNEDNESVVEIVEEEPDFSKLTERQKRFIDHYIETGNATEACRRAGYKDSKNINRIGSENLSKLDKYIYFKMSHKDKDRIASQDEVLEFLTRVTRGLEKDAFGLDASLQDRIKCAELLGKRHGTFIDKKDITSSTGIKVTIVDDVNE